MSKYLVTGGAGFIGSNLVNALVDKGHTVVVVDDLSTGKRENVNTRATLVVLDISNSSNDVTLTSVMSGCDGVFHLAALTSVQASIDEPITYNKVNVDGTLNVLRCCSNAGVKRVVYSASASAYGNASSFPTEERCKVDPMSPYGLQKLIGEQYCRVFSHCYNLETVCLRYFNVFGEGQSLTGSYCPVIGLFRKQHLDNEPMTVVGDGEQRRDFIHVSDVVRANILAMTSTKVGKGESINIGSGDNRSINQIADLFGGDKKYIANRLEPRISLSSIDKAKRLLDWEPEVTVEDWIRKDIS